MMSHTPGPWNISMSDNATPHIYANTGSWEEKLKDLICVMPAEIIQNFNSLNNARLIAAAPAMKEALELIVNDLELHIDKDKYVSRMLYTAKKAITLANGKDK